MCGVPSPATVGEGALHKLSLHKLESYSEVVESDLLVEMSAKKLQQYKKQHKRGRSDYPQGVQTQKKGQVLHEIRLSYQLTK